MTFKNAVQTNGDSRFIFCPIVLKYSILSFLIVTKMLIYFILPLGVSFSHNQQLKMSNFEENVTFPDNKIFRTQAQTDKIFFKSYPIYIWLMSTFFFHRLLVSETQTDRQTRQICNRYVYIYICIYTHTNICMYVCIRI